MKSEKCFAQVNAVHIVSVDNECKELLLVLTKEVKPLKVVCVNNEKVFSFDRNYKSPSQKSGITNPLQQEYLFEPNASIMKAGCFMEVADYYQICEVFTNSHLFVSDHEIPDFPGRGFHIEAITSMNKRELKAALQGIERANITVRNFPISVAELRKRLRLKDGGEVYIFATTVAEGTHQLFICRKIA